MIYKPEKIKRIKLATLVKDIKNVVKKSPVEINRSVDDTYDLPDSNERECQEYLKKNSKKIGEFFYPPNRKYDLYQNMEGNIIHYALIDKEYIVLVYDVKLIKIQNLNGVESINVIQSRIGERSDWLHIANKFVFNFLLKNYDFVVSDKIHYPRGRTFWKGLLYKAVGELYCYVYNMKDNTFSVLSDVNKQFDSAYGKGLYNIRFIISNKEL